MRNWCGTDCAFGWSPPGRDDEASSPYVPRTCIRPCCRLCRFSIKFGQDVIAITKDGRQSSPFPFPQDGDAHGHVERDLNAAFKSCFGPSCGHWGEKGAVCHAGCAAIAERLGLTPAEYLPVAECSYDPPWSDEERRRELVRFRLQQVLKKNLGRLPTEVWDLVAKDLICEYATVTILSIQPKTVFTVNPSEAVWARHIEIDGVEYVRSVSNVRCSGDRLLWDKPKSSTGHVLYVAEDHLGIRQITNCPEAARAAGSNAVSVWWRTVPVKDATIDFKTDGVKLRGFSAAALIPEVKWPCPMTPDEINGMSLFYTMVNLDAKMLPVDLNTPDTTGYSLAWRFGCTYLHAHKRGESLDFYRELDAKEEDQEIMRAGEPEDERRESRVAKAARMAEESGIEWVYHPLNAGEAVEQVWLRQPVKLAEDDEDHNHTPWNDEYLWSDSPHDIAIALRTNQGRTLFMGRHDVFPQRRYPWKCIAKTATASPTRIFFSYSLNGINLFAAPTSGVNEEEPIPEDLYDDDPDTLLSFGNDLHTSASLKNLAQVVPCKATDQGDPRVNGLLLRYKDGRERSVGRFRLDCAQPPLDWGKSSRMFVGVGGSGTPVKQEHVEAIRLSAPKDPGGLKWKKLPANEPILWSWRSTWSTVTYPSEEWGTTPVGSDEEEG